MKRTRRERTIPAAMIFFAFCAGMMFAWWLRSYGPPQPAIHAPEPVAATEPSRGGRDTVSKETAVRERAGSTSAATAPIGTSGDIPRRPLQVPIDGSNVESWKGAFYQQRDGRPHEAVDILAPRNTPVHAADDGSIAKLFVSKAGGNTIYQFDPDGRLCYYYAHLERYADGLREGQPVSRGQVIGYVGTSGNAPPDTPHLHFAVSQLNADRHWWQGRALDPYEVFRLGSQLSDNR
jgi:murein DD-endopeptidase MepM/ murein hydrolase activator NlpD